MTPSLNIKQDYAIRYKMVQEGHFVSPHPIFLLEPSILLHAALILLNLRPSERFRSTSHEEN